MFVCFGQEMAHLKDRDHGQYTDKEEDQRQKEPNCADKGGPVPDCPRIHTPRGWQVITVQANDDDHITLQPHPGVDNQGNDKEQHWLRAHPARPKRLRHENVAEHQRPEGPPIGAKGAVKEPEAFHPAARIPGGEALGQIAIGDKETGRQHYFSHIL